MVVETRVPIQVPPSMWNKRRQPDLAKFFDWIKSKGGIVEKASSRQEEAWWIRFDYFEDRESFGGRAQEYLVTLRCTQIGYMGWLSNYAGHDEHHFIQAADDVAVISAVKGLLEKLGKVDKPRKRTVLSITNSDGKDIYPVYVRAMAIRDSDQAIKNS